MIHNQRYFACSVGHCFDGLWGYLFWQHSAFTLVVITTAGELDSRSRYYRTLGSVEEEVPLPQFKCFVLFSTWVFRDCYEAGVPVTSQASSHRQVFADSYHRNHICRCQTNVPSLPCDMSLTWTRPPDDQLTKPRLTSAPSPSSTHPYRPGLPRSLPAYRQPQPSSDGDDDELPTPT